MTIGLAGYGPRAGAGVLAGLAAVEKVGDGAIGGFVSVAAITEAGAVLRIETQSGGRAALGDHPLLSRLVTAPMAALISSGPNRPAPLAAFLWADPQVGLVTGHRMPQLTDPSGRRLNALVGELMGQGATPQAAVTAVAGDHPDMDAGFLAVSRQRAFGVANTALVQRRRDLGHEIAEIGSAGAAAIHNSIRPTRPLAALAVDVALETMLPRTPLHWITLKVGVPVRHGGAAEIRVDGTGHATHLVHSQAPPSSEPWPFGTGERVRVAGPNGDLGILGCEPYMVQAQGRLLSIDGAQERVAPVIAPPPDPR